MTALEGMLKHQVLFNFLYDTGNEGELLEEDLNDDEEKENLNT